MISWGESNLQAYYKVNHLPSGAKEHLRKQLLEWAEKYLELEKSDERDLVEPDNQ